MQPQKLAKLALLVMIFSATHSVRAQCIEEIVVEGYRDWPDRIIILWAELYPTIPLTGSGPGGAYSANPTAHTNCTATTLSTAQEAGTSSTPSQPNNLLLPLPLRNANPVDIVNGSPSGIAYGGVNSASGFMVFPNYAAGANAAMKSVGRYAASGTTIAGLVNAWAPPSVNPNAMANTISDLGITQAMANSTPLSSLTSNQQLQVVAAFGWQEGFKPAGC
jgi:hypothetical protein